MLTCQRTHFDIPTDIHYLNGAYMSPLSHAVVAAGEQGLRQKAQPWQITPVDFFTQVDELKGLFAQIINAPDPQRIALVPSVSYGMAAIAKNLPVKAGQHIVIDEAQFPSHVYPWRALVQEKGLQIDTISYPADQIEKRGQTWQTRILEAITPDTALVALSHVHWANGTQFDLKAIGQRCREVGARLVIDGTQSVGALPFDVQAFGIDALVCAGYKWLMGPYSLGYAWFSEHYDGGLPVEENWTARANAHNFTALVDYTDAYQPGAARYDVGEKGNFILVPMGIAALRQLLDWGIENIQTYCHHLTRDAVNTWRQYGYWVEAEAWRAGHLFGLQLPPQIAVDSLVEALRQRRIFVSVRGNFVRISPNVYNNTADVAALTEALIKAAQSA